ncbi:hypothetical protein HPB49_023586 [Dermacentor silvarum]|uniref:Uncharacterized protein n=1 Tax=Dermacentor silvarum TaxID=543639 RepID=A0ACB8D8N1_DERSI|nr:hypothetical protein HPB49_023586 [Dermacentor silvarum]
MCRKGGRPLLYVFSFFLLTTAEGNSQIDCLDGPALKLLMDVDTGVDDAMALTLAATSPNVSIEAITVVAGNTNLSNAYNNTMRVLEQINRTDIPVYLGADRPIDGFWDYEAIYFGEDNFGNAGGKYAMGNNPAQDPDKHGYLKMIEIIKNSSNDLTLMLLGPLTNLAIALLVEPDLTENVSAIYILGGNIYGKGNIKPGSEFNFLTDPEAALVVLQRALCPVYIVPWEAVLDATVPWDIYYNITNQTGQLQTFLRDITNHTVHCCLTESPGFSLGDWLAALAAIVPGSVTKSLQSRVSVELTGTHTRGQLVHGWMPYMLTEAAEQRIRMSHVTVLRRCAMDEAAGPSGLVDADSWARQNAQLRLTRQRERASTDPDIV